MRLFHSLSSAFLSIPCLIGCGASDAASNASAPCTAPNGCGASSARAVAVGIPGAGAIRQVGQFLDASPLVSNAAFAPATATGELLAADRVLVASTSNFGAALARTDQLPGAILSLDASSAVLLEVPPTFAAGGGQAAAREGSVRLYAAQSADFLNSLHHADAATAEFPSVSRPLGISINNAFGRLWFANAPGMPSPAGTISITDPDGAPLAAKVSSFAGGVFSGSETNRPEQMIPGALQPETIATAFLGPSPDGSKKAVFAALNADGSLAQVHTLQGVDGLGDAVIHGISQELASSQGAEEAANVTRAGLIFNWVPEKVLFVTDPLANAIVAVHLTQDAAVYHVASTESFTSEYLDRPVDLAPVVSEIVSPEFASGTTLAGGSDFYVANRGNGTIVRMTQKGQVVAVHHVDVAGLGTLKQNRLNGIATSRDATRLWLSVSGALPGFADQTGFVVEVGAFGASVDK